MTTKMASFPIMRPSGIPTIFGELEERNITFLIDTSGSMFANLNIVKEHLIEVLLARAFKQKNTNFNIMEFSTEVTPWADKLVRCTPQTVTLAAEWIKNLKCKTQSNLKDAFIAAYADPSCDSIYLITDGLPDQLSPEILCQVELSSNGRPVHVIFFACCEPNPAAVEFLEQLAVQTDGTLHVISVSRNGRVECVKPVVSVDYTHARAVKSVQQPMVETVHTSILNSPLQNVHSYFNEDSVPNTSISTMLDNPPELMTTTYMAGVVETEAQKFCSVPTSLDNKPVKTEVVYLREPTTTVRTLNRYVLPNVAWESYSSHVVHPIMQKLDGNFSMTAGTLVTGMRVLARRDNDGYYYMGVVKQQVTVNRRFLIEFDEHPVGTRSNNRLQETAIYDIIGYNDGLRHSIVAGDNVLAPCEKDSVRYAPGTILESTEGRFAGSAADTGHLVVGFFNGTTKKIPKKTAIWLQKAHYDQIKLEIQMPLAARQYLVNDPHYPYQAPPGYYITPLPVEPTAYHTLMSDYPKIPLYIPSTGHYHNFHSSVQESVVKSEDMTKLIPGTTMTKDELKDKVMKQLMDHKMVTQDRVRLLNRDTWGKKSVSFRKSSKMDSGICSTQDVEDDGEESKESEHEQYDKKRNFEEVRLSGLTSTKTQTLPLHDIGIGTDSSLLYPNKESSPSEKRPNWRYWSKSLNSNELKFSNDDLGSFNETVLEAPLAQPYLDDVSPNGQVNCSPLFNSVVSSIKSDRARLEWVMKHPHPPPSYTKIAPGPWFGSKDAAREAKERSFLEYRRKQIISREESWKEKENQNAQMKAAKEERYRKYMADVIRRDVARQSDNEQKLRNVQEAKRAVSASITKQQQENAERQSDKDHLRIEAITQQKQRREDIKIQRQCEIEETMARRRAIKQQQTQRKWEEHSTDLKEKRDQEAAQDEMKRSKQMAIRKRFQDIEQANQQKKDLQLGVREQKLQELRSQVLP